MKTTQKRIDDLEAAASQKSGYMAIYADPDHQGAYYERSPFSKDPGKRFDEADLAGMVDDHLDLVIIEYTRKWRGYQETA